MTRLTVPTNFPNAEIVDIVAESAFGFVTNVFNNTFATGIDAAFPPERTNSVEAARV